MHPGLPGPSAVPEYISTTIICMVFLTAVFSPRTAEKWLDLNSFKGQTKAEEVGAPCPELLSFRVALKANADESTLIDMTLFRTAICAKFGRVSSTDRHYIVFLVYLLVLSCSLWWTVIRNTGFPLKICP